MTARPIAVVTGASAGVGRATVVALAERGFDVALLARGEAGLAAAAADVEAAGGRASAIPTDVAMWEEVDAAAERIERELGEIGWRLDHEAREPGGSGVTGARRAIGIRRRLVSTGQEMTRTRRRRRGEGT